MQKFIEFHFQPDVLGQFSLPPIGYPVPADFAPQLARCGSEVPFDLMLFWLQHKSADAGDQWMEVESAMHRLIQLLIPESDRLSVVAEAETWRLEIGSVFLDQQVVTIERDGALLAALRPAEDGRLVAASYRPLDADSLLLLMRLATRAHSRHGVAMCTNNWEYALDSTVTAENYFAQKRNEPYLSYFKFGIRDDEADVAPPRCTATQMEVFSRLNSP